MKRTPDKEERLILYNAVFMQEIAKKTKDYWSMIAIVAHEVGHHIRLHTMIGPVVKIVGFEREAGYQAGQRSVSRMGRAIILQHRHQSLAVFLLCHEGHVRSQLRLVRPMSNI